MKIDRQYAQGCALHLDTENDASEQKGKFLYMRPYRKGGGDRDVISELSRVDVDAATRLWLVCPGSAVAPSNSLTLFSPFFFVLLPLT
jgi:hypothetical protein